MTTSNRTPKVISTLFEGKKLECEHPILQVIRITGLKGSGQLKVDLCDGSDVYTDSTIPRKSEIVEGVHLKLIKFDSAKLPGKFILSVSEVEVLSSPTTIQGSPLDIIPGRSTFEVPKTIATSVSASLVSSIGLAPSTSAAPEVKKVVTSISTSAPSQNTVSTATSVRAPATMSAVPPPMKFDQTRKLALQTIDQLVQGQTRKKCIKVKATGRKEAAVSAKGCLNFSADFVDEKGGMIKTTFFKRECEVWDSYIETSAVYYVTGFTIKAADKRFCKAGTKWEIIVDDEVLFERCPPDDVIIIPMPKFQFKKISDIKGCKKDEIIDVVGLIIEVSDYITSHNAEGKAQVRRSIVLGDDSGHSVNVMIWGEQLRDIFDQSNCMHKLLALKDCKVTCYKDEVSLSSGSNNSVYLNQTDGQIPEMKSIINWNNSLDDKMSLLESCERINSIQKLSSADEIGGAPGRNLLNIKDLRPEKDKSVNSITLATVVRFEHETKLTSSSSTNGGAVSTAPAWYIVTCPKADCKNRKLTSLNHCENCSKTYNVGAIPKYSLRVEIGDNTVGLLCTAYGEQAERMLGVKVERLIELDDDKTRKEFNEIFSGRNIGKFYKFKIQSRGALHNEKLTAWHTISECFVTNKLTEDEKNKVKAETFNKSLIKTGEKKESKS
jgi:hypothetical protein